MRITRRGRLVVTSTVALALAGGTVGVLTLLDSPPRHADAASVRVGPTPRSTPTRQPTAAVVPAVVTRAVAAAGGDLSIAVYDAVDHRTWTYRDQPGRVEASVSKLDVLGATLIAQQGGAAQTEDVAQDEAAMIERSSNDAATDLYDRVGQVGIESFDRAVGARDIVYAQPGYFGLDTSTALDQVAVMKAYAYPNTVLTPASQAQASALFGQVEADQHWGASGGVPAGVRVDLKNGWLPVGTGWVVDTVAHVRGGGHDYVVAIMSAGNSTEQVGIDRLERVSAAIWATSGG